jgi:glycosyltransferase involved in cell wall biosynthesis
VSERPGSRKDVSADASGRRLRVLLIGPSPDLLEGAAVGGTTIPFKRLVEVLRARRDVAVTVVSTHGVRGGGLPGVVRFFGVLCRIARAIPRADVVSLHAVRVGLPLLGPYVSIVAGLARKSTIIRKFGGTDYSASNPLRRAAIHWAVKRAALYLVETKALVEGAKRDGVSHVRWYSNSRPMPELPEDSDPTRPCRRFVQVGQLRMGKGIREIIEAGERFGGDVAVDIYGTTGYDVPLSVFDGLSRVKYRGPVAPDRVREVLARYDVLLLPTTMETEGYPGVVPEAYSAGLPVICTRWRQLPEIVDDTTGILIEPRSGDALHRAMKSLTDDPALFARLRAGVRARRAEFSDTLWAERFVEHCRAVAR